MVAGGFGLGFVVCDGLGLGVAVLGLVDGVGDGLLGEGNALDEPGVAAAAEAAGGPDDEQPATRAAASPRATSRLCTRPEYGAPAVRSRT